MKNFILYISLTLTSFLYAQDNNYPKIDEYQIESSVFGTTRKVTVSTPVGYQENNKNKKYVVAYLFDGQFTPYFAMVNSAISYYSQVSEGIPMIVISIHTENRSLEFTPHTDSEKTKNGWRGNCGEADRLTKFIREEVIPNVENNYNVKPYRLAIGHSLGGTYVLTELMKKESLFNAAIAVSPNLNYDNEQIVEQGKTFFKENPNSRAFIYSSAGDQGQMENNFRKSLEKLDAIAKTNKPKNLSWEYEYLDGDTHMSTFLPTFDNGYLKFSKEWMISDEKFDEIAKSKKPIENYFNAYKNFTSFAGFEVEPDNVDLNNFAYNLSYHEKYEQAIDVLNIAIEKFPKDANLHDSKGEMYENLKKIHEANACYSKALEILLANPDAYDEESRQYYLETFTKNVNRTKKN
jgi:predicted alpha/beta superfamily hydrolase